MRLAIISPHYPPDRCGVGDYTARLAHALTEAGHEILVVTAQSRPLADAAPRAQLISREYPWHPARMGSLTRSIREFHPDAISVQYTPYLYAPRVFGIHPVLPAWMLWLRHRVGAPVALTAHERHYPVGVGKYESLVGVPQWAIFRALVLVSDHVFFSNECFRNQYQTIHPGKRDRFSWLPVGANIEPPQSSNSAGSAERDPATLVQFGGDHPTRLGEFTKRAWESVRAAVPGARLVILGAESGPAGSEALGYVDEATASRHLSRATLMLAPFLDGISTRRGSVMAALAHGCPVLSTRGGFTDPSANWDRYSELVDAHDANAFAQSAVRLIGDSDRRRELSKSATTAYQTRFKWSLIAAEMTSRLESLAKARY